MCSPQTDKYYRCEYQSRPKLEAFIIVIHFGSVYFPHPLIPNVSTKEIVGESEKNID